MRHRDLDWIRRNTTAQDLLDDGIENSSNLDSIPASGSIDPPVPNARSLEAMEIRRATLERVRQETEKQLHAQHKRSFSRLGLLIGAALAISGMLVMTHPKEMFVEHSRIKYLPSVVEHVTRNGARFYGAVLFVSGITLCGYSLYRPKING